MTKDLDIAPAGMPQIMGKRALRHTLRAWFEVTGGIDKLVAVSEESSENYIKVLSLHVKMEAADKEQTPEGVEEFLKKIKVIEGTATEVLDAGPEVHTEEGERDG